MYKKLEFDLGRNALVYLVKQYDIKELHIPYYLCDVVRHALVEAGCKPIFYHIDDNFMPVKNFSKNDFILYPNYFGICSKNVKKLTESYPKIIVDNAHAYYDEPNGFACFYCGHKFGFNGAELYYDNDFQKNSTQYRNVDKKAKLIQQKFIELSEKYDSSNCLNIFNNMADISPFIYTYPFVYPYLASTEKDADMLVKNLESEGKVIYRYWNELPRTYNEYKFYSKLVPVPLS